LESRRGAIQPKQTHAHFRHPNAMAGRCTVARGCFYVCVLRFEFRVLRERWWLFTSKDSREPCVTGESDIPDVNTRNSSDQTGKTKTKLPCVSSSVGFHKEKMSLACRCLARGEWSHPVLGAAPSRHQVGRRSRRWRSSGAKLWNVSCVRGLAFTD